MKKIVFALSFVSLFSLVLSSCFNTVEQPQIADEAPPTDSLKTRTPLDKKNRISVKDAFIKLSHQELLLDGIKNMSVHEKKELLKLNEDDNYKIQWVGNYLQITEKPKNVDDKEELIEQVRLAAFNSLNKNNILFVSQELVDKQRKISKIIHQGFFQFNHQAWENIDFKIPSITTQTFLENKTKYIAQKDYFYFNLDPADVNYLQAILIHENYPDKDKIAKKEAYKVALVWTGNEFRLDRQAMVNYDISEHHPD